MNTTENAQRNRVNIGVMALEDGTVLAVRPVDPIGTGLADARVFELDLGGNAQINDIHSAFDIGPVADIVMEMTVQAGRGIGFVSVLDGNISYAGTSDPTTILPVAGGSNQVTLLELGPIRGLNEFSGSASISNFSPSEAIVQADYHNRGVPGVAASATVTIPAGGTLGFENMVGELFSVENQVGTVVLTSMNDTLIHATGREFAIFRDEDGEISGTAGQLIPGLREADLLTADTIWHFLGLKQAQVGDLTERSHFAAFNPGSSTVTVSVSLFNAADGNPEGERAWTVRAGELIQINQAIKAINPDHDADEKRIEVTVTGPVHLKVFRVNGWGDPITVDGFAG